MRRRSWLFGLVLLAVASAVAAEASGERFVTPPVPDADAWELVQDPAHPSSRLWKSRQDERNQYRIDVLKGSPDGLPEARMTLDAPGKARCRRFDTTTIEQSRINGYPRILWRTDCVREDGTPTTHLHLVIRGRDGLYLALKSWPIAADDAELERWIEHFERHLVCDPRTPAHPCPPGDAPPQ